MTEDSIKILHILGHKVHIESKKQVKDMIADGRCKFVLNRSVQEIYEDHSELNDDILKKFVMYELLEAEDITRPVTKFKNKHKGDRAFILGSGMSVNPARIDRETKQQIKKEFNGLELDPPDLSLLKNEITFGINRIGFSDIKPTYYCIMDRRVYDENPDLFANAEEEYKDKIFSLKNMEWDDLDFVVKMNMLDHRGFSDDLSIGVNPGYTTAWVALQVAVYMGCSPIYLLGVDFWVSKTMTHFFEGKVPKQISLRDRAISSQQFDNMRMVFYHFAPKLQRRGIEVYNCSPISTIRQNWNIYKYKPFKDVINE